MVPSCGFDTIFSISNPIWNQIFHFFFRNPNYNFHFFHFRISQSGRVAGTGSAPVISRIWLLRLKLTCPTCVIYSQRQQMTMPQIEAPPPVGERRIRKSPKKTVFIRYLKQNWNLILHFNQLRCTYDNYAIWLHHNIYNF